MPAIRVLSLGVLAPLLLLALSAGAGAADKAEPFSLLVFSKTAGFRHDSIAAGTEMVKKLGAEHGFTVEATEDAAVFTADGLKKFKVVVFLNTTGDVLNDEQQKAFEGFIKSGRGYVGIHSASDTEYGWEWYGKMVGGYFAGHDKIVEATVNVTDRTHACSKHLPEKWKRTDEWYKFKNFNSAVKVVADLDESTLGPNSQMGGKHPAAWYHEYDGGRAFYTAGGHTKESYTEPLFVQHILGAIGWAAGGK